MRAWIGLAAAAVLVSGCQQKAEFKADGGWVRRVAYPDLPVPYAKNLEKVLLPDREKVVAAARELMAY